MRNNSFFKIILIAITAVFFTSCDKDFNSIGGDLIGNEHFGLERRAFDVVSYNQKVGPVQSNNLAVNALGVYDDAVFGTTQASFVTQVVLASVDPVVGANPEIENVILSVPYFSTITNTSTAGDNTYRLDSIYGSDKGKIKLSIYENGYFMSDLDPSTGFLETQKFYTNQASDFEGQKKSTLLNNDVFEAQNTAFFFDATEFKETTPSTTEGGEPIITRTPPGMRLSLDKAYFKTRIIDAAKKSDGTDPGKLTTNDVFKNYFKGLYFKVEKSGSNEGRMALMNFAKGTITIKYKEDLVTSTTVNGVTTSTTTRVEKSIVLNLTGNTVSLMSNVNQPDYNFATAPENINKVSGDQKLYLKGGEGALSVVELFDSTDVRGYDDEGKPTLGKNNVPDQLDDLRNPESKKKLLINEANLVFHVDAATMGANKIPSRLYLYDLNNHRPILDYATDGTAGLPIYGGFLNATKVDDNTYKFRITNHIRNLIDNKDSTNVKLGVAIANVITNSAMNKLRLPLQSNTTLTQAPQSSVMSPLGVVIYGGNTSVPEGKRLKLEIYYTKPN